jgi:secondary thiamine-phosphate synthase enzyme
LHVVTIQIEGIKRTGDAMNAMAESIELTTSGGIEIVDITDRVVEAVSACGLQNGTATAFIGGATGAITTLEAESGALQDLKDCIERFAPRDATYKHDAAYGDGNGHSHVRAALLKPEVTVPVIDGRLALGTWQRVAFLELDNRPRHRSVLVQCLGEFA